VNESRKFLQARVFTLDTIAKTVLIVGIVVALGCIILSAAIEGQHLFGLPLGLLVGVGLAVIVMIPFAALYLNLSTQAATLQLYINIEENTEDMLEEMEAIRAATEKMAGISPN
jgi:uncharacterized membrane protein